MPFAQPLRFAWRSLRRTPAFTATAALTLIIGIGATVAIFAVVNGVLLKPLPYGNPERLVGAWHDLPAIGIGRANQSSGTYFTYQRLSRSIDGIAAYQDGASNVSEPGSGTDPQRLATGFITATLLPVLQVSPAIGRNFSDDEDRANGPGAVIISDALWRTRFGSDARILGRTLDVNGRTREVIGIMPRGFAFGAVGNQLWLPLGLDPNATFSGGFNYNSVVRLKAGVTIETAQRDFATVLPRSVEIMPNFAPGFTMQMLLDQAKPVPSLTPLRADVIGDIVKTLWMVAAAAGLVLLVACANVANLILVRADGRQRELAVREALGAGRARVLGHFLAESVVIAGIAGAAAIGLAAAAVRVLVRFGPQDMPRLTELGMDPTTVLFAIALTAMVAVVCSVIPALRIGRVHMYSALREGGRAGTAGRTQHRVRGALVAAQIALALVVLAGSGLLVRTFQRLNAVQPGFAADNVVTLWLSLPAASYQGDSSLARFYAQLRGRVAELPGVQEAGLTSRLPLMERGGNSSPIYPSGDPSYERQVPPLQLITTVDGNYFRAMRIPVIAGRNFDRLELQRPGDAIVSRATAIQFWKDSTGRAAIGQRMRQLPGGPEYTIIGVVGDVRDTSLTSAVAQVSYFPQVAERDTLMGSARRQMALVIRTAGVGGGDPLSIASAVQGVVRELDPTLPTFDVRPMSAVLRASTARLTFVIIILGSAAVVTLLLGAIGLYGVMAYLVTLRTRELGVRIALGAQPAAVAAMMARQGLTLTAIGIVGGLGLFALVARFLRSFLFGVAPTDPVALVGAALTLIVVAAVASWVPARRAARVDPANALRAE
ncbi:MAG: ABC transporter permease [Gemmatimonadaceae bacterium]